MSSDVSNAVTVETSKFLDHLRLIMATVNDPIVYTTNAYTLRQRSKEPVM